MTYEAQIRDRLSNDVNMIVADGAGIEKGTIMALTDGRVVAASSGAQEFGGILMREKIANDGRTSVPCNFYGIFDLYATSGAAITVGDCVSLSGANMIKEASEAEIQAGLGIGKALETTAEATAETIQVFVGHF